ncbi:MAG: HAMP domain-containing histidine kinase [Limnobacter sp.]|nr:HAMP domain-containing histidine kinase [Limnobacter sp.]
MTLLALASVSLVLLPVEVVSLLLPPAVAVLALCVTFAKLKSRVSSRVPPTEKIWCGVVVISSVAFVFGMLFPQAQQSGITITIVSAFFASLNDRHFRYRMARTRILKRRAQQSRWRHSKRAVLLAWKERMRWLAGVQHDMRQPLHALGLLLGHPTLKGNKHAEEVLNRILSCQRWLQDLAENTMEASRLELGEQRAMVVGSVNSRELCQSMHTWLGPLAESKELGFVVEAEAHSFHTDVRCLKRVLGNLLFNAVEHSFEGQVGLKYRKMGAIHEFTVTDNGPGLGEAFFSEQGLQRSAGQRFA